MNRWAMIQNMKVYIPEHNTVFDIHNIDMINLYGDKALIVANNEDVGKIDFSESIPLFTFPEKDSKGQMCWSGDLLRYKFTGHIYLLWFDGFTWQMEFLNKDEAYGVALTAGCINLKFNRLCSIFELEAAEHLDTDTINKLKGIMGG